MIDGLLRDMDRASDEFIPFYLAGLTTRAEDLAFCERQERRIALCYRAGHTAGAVGLIRDVLDGPDTPR